MRERRHFDRELYGLDERIARLALLCGVDLSDANVLMSVIQGHLDEGRNLDRMARRVREELRGLLILKYQIQSSCIDAIGATECAALLSEQGDQLRRHGFPARSLTKIR